MRVIFLDIDGPIINEGCYGTDFLCSSRRTVMNTSAIGWLNYLCRQAEALIVTNSSHNNHDIPFGEGSYRSLRHDLIHHGVEPDYFHPNWRTDYPSWIGFSDEHLMSPEAIPGGKSNRLSCIEKWLAEHENPDWVCFDDANFTRDRRLILVDFRDGIQGKHIDRAFDVFGVQPKGRLI